MTNNRDVQMALVLACAMTLAVLMTDNYFIRIALAFPLLFFATGHLALRLIGTRFAAVEHALASVGLSLAICVLGCFVLYAVSKLLPGSALSPIGWSLWFLVVVGLLFIWIIAFDVPGELVIRRPPGGLVPHALIGLAAVIAVIAYTVALDGEANTREFSYTEFGLVPTKPGKYTIGIKNLEFQPQTYSLRVVSHDTTVVEVNNIALRPGEGWTRTVDSMYKAEGFLYRDNHVYRHVSAFPNNKEPVE